MSTLYNFKIMSSKNSIIPSDVLYELHTDSSCKNLRFELKRLNIDASQEEKVVRFRRFKEILHDKLSNEREFFAAFENVPALNETAIMNLENNYERKQAQELFHCKTFVYHQLLSELFPSKFTALKVTEVMLEMVSVHPDAGYPTKRINDRVLLNDKKKLALRLLSDIYPGIDEKKAQDVIYRWFESKKQGSFFDSALEDFDKIVWGIETVESIVIKPTSKAFWKKHENAWWKPIFNNYSESDNKPYEFQKLRIVLPLGWFPEFAAESEVFDSAAFW